MIVTPLLHFCSDEAESLRHRTPHPTPYTSEKQGLAFISFPHTFYYSEKLSYVEKMVHFETGINF